VIVQLTLTIKTINKSDCSTHTHSISVSDLFSILALKARNNKNYQFKIDFKVGELIYLTKFVFFINFGIFHFFIMSKICNLGLRTVLQSA
jgi:hypothetical protein